jgi:hypothetical protein
VGAILEDRPAAVEQSAWCCAKSHLHVVLKVTGLPSLASLARSQLEQRHLACPVGADDRDPLATQRYLRQLGSDLLAISLADLRNAPPRGQAPPRESGTRSRARLERLHGSASSSLIRFLNLARLARLG